MVYTFLCKATGHSYLLQMHIYIYICVRFCKAPRACLSVRKGRSTNQLIIIIIIIVTIITIIIIIILRPTFRPFAGHRTGLEKDEFQARPGQYSRTRCARSV